MDIFVRHIPVHTTEKQLRALFTSPLQECGISVFAVNKFNNKPFATITVLDAKSGRLFLQQYGDTFGSSKKPLILNCQHVSCSASRKPPDEFLLRSLASEASQQNRKHKLPVNQKTQTSSRNLTTFSTSSLCCGAWTYTSGQLTFESYFNDQRRGNIVFGNRQAVLQLQRHDVAADRIDIHYQNVDTVLTGENENPTVTFTLVCPPKFYRRHRIDDGTALALLLGGLSFNNQAQSKQPEKKMRVSAINTNHEAVVGICFVYQIRLANASDLSTVHRLVNNHPKVQSTAVCPTPTYTPPTSLQESMIRLNFALTVESGSGALPFGVKFQIFRLAQNGKLLPENVRKLLPFINRLVHDVGEPPTVDAIRRLYRYLEQPGPHTEASDYSHATLSRLLEQHAHAYIRYGSEDAYALANRHKHIALIHKINVTPAGIYLEGPQPEVTNRVLREYPDHNDHFIRVCFMDEDGESVRHDPRASQDEIFRKRFKTFLNGTYIIAGRGFSFLGFSHSSLRSQACWFMSPFTMEGSIMMAPLVIEKLGDFSTIRSPARCAARIGQAFTDTTGTVEVEAEMLAMLPDVTRNGRVFSDGVGTISESLLKRVWRVYGTRKSLKPTVLQIRFAGAKGVVSLDTRVPEDQLTIRPSMVKFEGSESRKIEICGAAFRPLPMILNRGYIKILEDLGVPLEVFMKLQNTAVERLRMMTTSTINASTFLQEIFTSKAAQLPELLECLSDIGLQYQTDTFLRDVVEMAVVIKLRDIKYRGRIPVENGVTLYGIMDETGYLQEGEVYVVVEKPPQGGREVLTGGRVIITRSPALHPGDIRVVKAVDVPDESPLNKLSNCVVFSQYGERDLPSQLSGGDLDGDLYNVIFEPGLMPRRPIADPADYPRITPEVLDRPVLTKDMTDFFVKFMETDQLGQISTIHVQLADRKPCGVFDSDCIKLAEMASTAVDFSKTGIPVNMKECPRYDRNRPDFMAPSPRAIIESSGVGILQEEDEEHNRYNDPVADLDPETRPMRYYTSEKALGHLYRAIDEDRFLQRLHVGTREDTLMPRLWNYVKRNNTLVQWENNRKLARQIKEAYESALEEMLYQYAPSPHHPLTESEIFAGTILGREGGASSRRLREVAMTMRERFEEVLEFTVSRIVNGDADGEDRHDEAFPRAMACFAVAMEESSLYVKKLGELKSWRYVAAGTCLREMKRWLAVGSGQVLLPRY